MTTRTHSKKTNMDKIDDLQMKCFAMLGAIAKLKEGTISLEDKKGVEEFSAAARELLMITNGFFMSQPPQANE